MPKFNYKNVNGETLRIGNFSNLLQRYIIGGNAWCECCVMQHLRGFRKTTNNRFLKTKIDHRHCEDKVNGYTVALTITICVAYIGAYCCFFVDFMPIHLPFIPIPFIFPRDLVFLLSTPCSRQMSANYRLRLDLTGHFNNATGKSVDKAADQSR